MAAIKEGNLDVKYDAPFIFAEVNADVIHWMVYRDGRRVKVSRFFSPLRLLAKVRRT